MPSLIDCKYFTSTHQRPRNLLTMQLVKQKLLEINHPEGIDKDLHTSNNYSFFTDDSLDDSNIVSNRVE